MITDKDRETLRNAEQSAMRRAAKMIDAEWLKTIGFTDRGDGPERHVNGSSVLVSRVDSDDGVLVYIDRSPWPKAIHQRYTLLAIIAALEAE